MRTVFIYITLIAAILSTPFTSQAQEKYGRFFAGTGLSYVGEDFDDGDLKKVPGNSNIEIIPGALMFLAVTGGSSIWLLKATSTGTPISTVRQEPSISMSASGP